MLYSSDCAADLGNPTSRTEITIARLPSLRREGKHSFPASAPLYGTNVLKLPIQENLPTEFQCPNVRKHTAAVLRSHLEVLSHLNDEAIISKWLRMSDDRRLTITSALYSSIVGLSVETKNLSLRSEGFTLPTGKRLNKNEHKTLMKRNEIDATTSDNLNETTFDLCTSVMALKKYKPSPTKDSSWLSLDSRRLSITYTPDFLYNSTRLRAVLTLKRPRTCLASYFGCFGLNFTLSSEIESSTEPRAKRRRTLLPRPSNGLTAEPELFATVSVLNQAVSPSSKVSLGMLLSPSLQNSAYCHKDAPGLKASTKYRIQRALQRLEFRKISEGAAVAENRSTGTPPEIENNKTRSNREATEPVPNSLCEVSMRNDDVGDCFDGSRGEKSSSSPRSSSPISVDNEAERDHQPATDSTSDDIPLPVAHAANPGTFLYQWPQPCRQQEHQQTSISAAHTIIPYSSSWHHVSVLDPSRMVQSGLAMFPNHSQCPPGQIFQHPWFAHSALNPPTVTTPEAIIFTGKQEISNRGTFPDQQNSAASHLRDAAHQFHTTPGVSSGLPRPFDQGSSSIPSEMKKNPDYASKFMSEMQAANLRRPSRLIILQRMASLNYDDPQIDGRHKEQWAAIALHVLNKYEILDANDESKSKSFVRLCLLKKEVRRQNPTCARITINHLKEVFNILRLPVSGEWDRRGHGGKRGPYVYGIRAKDK